jgi:RimJ/RimL family protein N-acetyltransferase
MKVERLSKENWAVLAEAAHLVVFGEHKSASMDRIDFALLGLSMEGTPMGFITCREFDQDTLYWQFGGAFPDTRGTHRTFSVYQRFIDWCRGKYTRITTLIENTNTAMLKMAMKVGFRIVGIRYYRGSILVEHLLELNSEGV